MRTFAVREPQTLPYTLNPEPKTCVCSMPRSAQVQSRRAAAFPFHIDHMLVVCGAIEARNTFPSQRVGHANAQTEIEAHRSVLLRECEELAHRRHRLSPAAHSKSRHLGCGIRCRTKSVQGVGAGHWGAIPKRGVGGGSMQEAGSRLASRVRRRRGLV